MPELPVHMATQPGIITWTQLLAALRGCNGELVLIRDGRETAAASAIRSRPAATGTELCFFTGAAAGAAAPKRSEVVAQLETLSKGAGRRFMSSAKASVNGTSLLIDGAADEIVDGATYAVVTTRRPKLGFNRSQATASSALGRSSKRIKTT